MELTSSLPWKMEKQLQQLFGNVSLSLLYKSSIHRNGFKQMFDKCCNQGSTITMFYNSKFILGAFLFRSYPEEFNGISEPNSSLFFLFERGKTAEMTSKYLITALQITDGNLTFYCSKDKILSVESLKNNCSLHQILLDGLRSYTYSFRFSECEVFRVEGTKNKGDYISKITQAIKYKSNLLAELRDYKTYDNMVSEIRILLLGPVGSGKSSFFNSVKSVFQGHVTRQAAVGSDITSITEQYRVYSIRDGKDGKSLPFLLCDSMGLDDKEGAGLCVDDIPHVLKGNISDRYQFTSHKPITSNHPAFIASPSLKDKIHCVAYVLDTNSVDTLSSKMVSIFKQIRREALSCGIALVVLLTNLNNYSDVLQGDFLNMSELMISQNQRIVNKVHELLSIPIFNIFMVENYASELELDPLKDILILSALRQMLRAADDALEDLPLEEID